MFKRLALGDESALQQIIDKYSDALLEHIFRIARNRHWAEEIQMDAFLELWEQRQKVALMEYPRAWLFKVAYYKANDRMRKESAHSLVSVEVLKEVKTEVPLEDEIDANEIRKIIMLAVEQLPPKGKKVYLLNAQEQWPVKKIAGILGRSPNTIRNELVISRKSLIKMIRNYLHLLLF